MTAATSFPSTRRRIRCVYCGRRQYKGNPCCSGCRELYKREREAEAEVLRLLDAHYEGQR